MNSAIIQVSDNFFLFAPFSEKSDQLPKYIFVETSYFCAGENDRTKRSSRPIYAGAIYRSCEVWRKRHECFDSGDANRRDLDDAFGWL